jgi:hypothetical protein
MVGVEEDRTYKLPSRTTSEPGRYVESLGEPRDGPRTTHNPGREALRNGSLLCDYPASLNLNGIEEFAGRWSMNGSRGV